MTAHGWTCEIADCSNIANKNMVSILKYPIPVPKLKPNPSSHGTLVRVCPNHAEKFGIHELIELSQSPLQTICSCGKWKSEKVLKPSRHNDRDGETKRRRPSPAQARKAIESEFAVHVRIVQND